MVNGNSKSKNVTTPINWLERLNHSNDAPYFVNPNNTSQSSSSN